MYPPPDVNITPPLRVRRSARIEMTLAVVFHTLCVVWIWRSWGAGLRGGWLWWIDLPVSLFYGTVPGSWLLAASLLLGGLQWAFIGLLLWRLVGALTERPSGRDD